MSFQSPSSFLAKVTSRFNLSRLATSSLICRRANEILTREWPEAECHATQFDDGILTLQSPSTTAASALYMRQNEILDLITSAEMPAQVTGLKLVVARAQRPSEPR